MPPSPYPTTVSFVVLFVLTTYVPMLAASLPITAFQDRRVFNSSPADDKLVFDVAFPLVLFVALAITYVWISSGMTINRFVTSINRLLRVSFTLAEQVFDLLEQVFDELEQVIIQLSYLRVDTILRIFTSPFIDANDARRDINHPTGGPASPISTPARFPPRR